MWLAQSIRYIDYIANKGIPISLFFEMILYLMPNLVVIVTPIAVLIGVLFVYNKLITDHELVVMQASGVGYWKLACPALIVSLIFMLIVYVFNLYLLPLSFRNYRDITTALREKSLASLVEVGRFNTFGKYTVYARSQDAQGNFLGIVIYDGSQEKKSITFMAEKGILFNKEEGGRLLLIKGNRQEKDVASSKPSILYFDRYVIEAKEKAGIEDKGERFLKAYERSVGDLLNPKEALSASLRLEFLSAAHQRLISPLYAFAFGLLGVCAMILGHFNRKGRTGKILITCIFATLLEVGIMVLLHTLKYPNLMIPISYGLLISTILICFLLLTPLANGLVNVPLRWRRS